MFIAALSPFECTHHPSFTGFDQFTRTGTGGRNNGRNGRAVPDPRATIAESGIRNTDEDNCNVAGPLG